MQLVFGSKSPAPATGVTSSDAVAPTPMTHVHASKTTIAVLALLFGVTAICIVQSVPEPVQRESGSTPPPTIPFASASRVLKSVKGV